jgi:hypothetical protein
VSEKSAATRITLLGRKRDRRKDVVISTTKAIVTG